MADVQHKRGTRANLNTLAGSSGLKVGQLYVITDEGGRIAVATSTSAYETFVRGSTKVTVGTSAPSSPATGDIWVDSN